jgi:hypothetical protein
MRQDEEPLPMPAKKPFRGDHDSTTPSAYAYVHLVARPSAIRLTSFEENHYHFEPSKHRSHPKDHYSGCQARSYEPLGLREGCGFCISR